MKGYFIQVQEILGMSFLVNKNSMHHCAPRHGYCRGAIIKCNAVGIFSIALAGVVY